MAAHFMYGRTSLPLPLPDFPRNTFWAESFRKNFPVIKRSESSFWVLQFFWFDAHFSRWNHAVYFEYGCAHGLAYLLHGFYFSVTSLLRNVSPMFVRLILHELKSVGKILGTIYAVSTAGGIFFTPSQVFLLFPISEFPNPLCFLRQCCLLFLSFS